MRLFVKFLPISMLFLAACSSVQKNPWREVTKPTAQSPQAIGFYSAGCLTGGKSMPAEGAGYVVMRPSRRRYYGHPDLVHFIETFGTQTDRKKLGTLLIGDLAQPRGGPTLTGHASHQTGLDVDIWFWQPPSKSLTLDEQENLSALSMLGNDRESLDMNQWSSKKIELLKLASSFSEVERIFVHPVIKRELCAKAKGEAWLQKIRPWWGHDDHFHVRLRCPKDDTTCKLQEAAPQGDGCDKAFEDAWFSPEAKALAARKSESVERPKMPLLPEACQNVLTNPL